MQSGLTLALFVFSLCFTPAVWADSPAAAKTWRVVGELTEAERQLFDPRADTPRDPEQPYIPAERYPFQPPYTAGWAIGPWSSATRRAGRAIWWMSPGR